MNKIKDFKDREPTGRGTTMDIPIYDEKEEQKLDFFDIYAIDQLFKEALEEERIKAESKGIRSAYIDQNGNLHPTIKCDV